MLILRAVNQAMAHVRTSSAVVVLVAADMGVSKPGVVVDHGVDERVHQEWLLVLVLARGGGVPVALALLVSDEPPADAVGDVAQCLGINVDQRAGMVVLVTTHWFPGCALDVGWTIQPG